MEKKVLFLVFAFLISCSFVLAGFDFSEEGSSLDYSYGPNSKISGKINISFTNEPVDSVFEGEIEGSSEEITLKEVLENTEGYSYSCDRENCSPYYEKKGDSWKRKSFTLDKEEEEVVGFYFETNNVVLIDDINNISFKVESVAGESFQNQIEIDFFNDKEVDIVNSKSVSGNSDEDYEEPSYGCFEDVSDSDIKKASLKGGDYVCERIELPVSPALRIGGNLKNVSGGNLSAGIYSKDNLVELRKCNLDESSLEEDSFNPIGCELDYSVSKPSEYYICIHNEDSGGEYKIESSFSEVCGFSGESGELGSKELASFKVFAQKKKFASPEFELNNPEDEDENKLSEKIYYFLDDITENSMNCSEGCIVPVKITSNVDSQEITLKDLDLSLDYTAGSDYEMKEFSSFSEVPAKVNSSSETLSLELLNFTSPESSGEFDFSLDYKDEKIFYEDNLSVKDVAKILSVYPNETAVGYPTEFGIQATSVSNISSFSWDFGDNSSVKTTSGPFAEHTYSSEGNYTIEVTASYEDGTKISATSDITVGVPDEVISKAFDEKKSKLDEIESDISGTGFSKEVLEEAIKLNNISNRIDNLETSYESNKSKENLKRVLKELLSIELPKKINEELGSDSIKILVEKSDIDIGALEEMGNGSSVSDTEAYKDEILRWNNNLSKEISVKVFSIEYSNNYSEKISVFKLDLNEEGNLGGKYYAFLDSSGLNFVNNVSSESVYNYEVLEREGGDSIKFYFNSEKSISDISAFFSPPLSSLSVISSDIVTDKTDESKNWWLLGLILFFLILLGIGAYIFLQRWYDKKYEDYLFKNKNQLYNLINYIHSSKEQGKSDDEVKENLKKVGWSGEQIRYVMRKYAGKRTGMKKLFNFSAEKKASKKKTQGKKPLPKVNRGVNK